MLNDYREVYDDTVFAQSRCIDIENNLLDFLGFSLSNLGYRRSDYNPKVWQRGDKTVVTCLVDDYISCTKNYSATLPYMFDSNTVVITDNFVQTPTQYSVCQLPVSFFGIYAHVPDAKWNPQRRFSFGVNRIDNKRILLMLELALRSEFFDHNTDYINFNCWDWNGDNTTKQGLAKNFADQYRSLNADYKKVYQSTYDRIVSSMPIQNYDIPHEEIYTASWLNIVMETYSSDNTVTLSEKTFRAMCLPVPWQLYAGRNAVAYLHSLGFDTMQDLVTHRYDPMIENRTAAYGDKMVDFLFEATENVQNLQQQEFESIAQRCQLAAERNQQLLALMRYNWPRDFARWWPTVLEQIQ